MKNRIKFILKSVSIALVFSLLLENFSFGAQEIVKPLDTNQGKSLFGLGFDLPESIASIEDSYKAPNSSRTIYLLQDAHTNTSGQLNLSKTLDLILKHENRDSRLDETIPVFLEAGQGNESLSFLRKYASLQERKKIAGKFLHQAKLQGSEYLDLTSNHNFALYGVEDMSLYAQALESYKAVAKQRIKYQDYLNKIQSTIKVLKSRIYNPLLLSLDESHTQHQKGSLSITQYLKKLTSNQNLKDYPHLKSLKKLQRLEQVLEKQKKNYPKLSTLNHTKKLSSNLQAKTILKELEDLEQKSFDSLTTTEDERTLLKISKVAGYFQKLLSLTMTPEEYKEYGDSKMDIRNLTGFLNKKIMDLKSYYENALFLEEGFEDVLKASEDFYDLTLKRDQAFMNNMLSVIASEAKQSSLEIASSPLAPRNDKQVAVLITGGYHTQNLKKLFKEQNISYVVLTPAITHETNQKRYESLLLGQNRSLLPKQTPFVSARPISNTVMLMRALLDIARAIGGEEAIREFNQIQGGDLGVGQSGIGSGGRPIAQIVPQEIPYGARLALKKSDFIQDHYAILGLSTDASANEIKIKYRQLIMQWHPDRNQKSLEIANKKSSEINSAYEILGDLEKRKEYDRYFKNTLSKKKPFSSNTKSRSQAGSTTSPGFKNKPTAPEQSDLEKAFYINAFKKVVAISEAIIQARSATKSDIEVFKKMLTSFNESERVVARKAFIAMGKVSLPYLEEHFFKSASPVSKKIIIEILSEIGEPASELLVNIFTKNLSEDFFGTKNNITPIFIRQILEDRLLRFSSEQYFLFIFALATSLGSLKKMVPDLLKILEMEKNAFDDVGHRKDIALRLLKAKGLSKSYFIPILKRLKKKDFNSDVRKNIQDAISTIKSNQKKGSLLFSKSFFEDVIIASWLLRIITDTSAGLLMITSTLFRSVYRFTNNFIFMYQEDFEIPELIAFLHLKDARLRGLATAAIGLPANRSKAQEALPILQKIATEDPSYFLRKKAKGAIKKIQDGARMAGQSDSEDFKLDDVIDPSGALEAGKIADIFSFVLPSLDTFVQQKVDFETVFNFAKSYAEDRGIKTRYLDNKEPFLEAISYYMYGKVLSWEEFVRGFPEPADPNFYFFKSAMGAFVSIGSFLSDKPFTFRELFNHFRSLEASVEGAGDSLLSPYALTDFGNLEFPTDDLDPQQIEIMNQITELNEVFRQQQEEMISKGRQKLVADQDITLLSRVVRVVMGDIPSSGARLAQDFEGFLQKMSEHAELILDFFKDRKVTERFSHDRLLSIQALEALFNQIKLFYNGKFPIEKLKTYLHQNSPSINSSVEILLNHYSELKDDLTHLKKNYDLIRELILPRKTQKMARVIRAKPTLKISKVERGGLIEKYGPYLKFTIPAEIDSAYHKGHWYEVYLYKNTQRAALTNTISFVDSSEITTSFVAVFGENGQSKGITMSKATISNKDTQEENGQEFFTYSLTNLKVLPVEYKSLEALRLEFGKDLSGIVDVLEGLIVELQATNGLSPQELVFARNFLLKLRQNFISLHPNRRPYLDGARLAGLEKDLEIDRLISTLVDGTVTAKIDAVEKLGKIGPPAQKAVPGLIEILQQEGFLSLYAAEALVKIAPDSEEVALALVGLFSSAAISETAKEVFGEMSYKAQKAPEVLEAYQKHLKISKNESSIPSKPAHAFYFPSGSLKKSSRFSGARLGEKDKKFFIPEGLREIGLEIKEDFFDLIEINKKKDLGTFSAGTKLGGKRRQLDRYLVEEVTAPGFEGWLAAVADGYGKNSEAVQMAIGNILEFLEDELGELKLIPLDQKELPLLDEPIKGALDKAFLKLHDSIEFPLSGTTLSVVYKPTGSNRLYVGILGDSPVGVVDSEGKLQIPSLHNGGINADYLVYRALGVRDYDSALSREPDIYSYEIGPESVLVLMSDGMIDGGFSEENVSKGIQKIIDSVRLGKKAGDLVSSKYHDNNTLIVWEPAGLGARLTLDLDESLLKFFLVNLVETHSLEEFNKHFSLGNSVFRAEFTKRGGVENVSLYQIGQDLPVVVVEDIGEAKSEKWYRSFVQTAGDDLGVKTNLSLVRQVEKSLQAFPAPEVRNRGSLLLDVQALKGQVNNEALFLPFMGFLLGAVKREKGYIYLKNFDQLSSDEKKLVGARLSGMTGHFEIGEPKEENGVVAELEFLEKGETLRERTLGANRIRAVIAVNFKDLTPNGQGDFEGYFPGIQSGIALTQEGVNLVEEKRVEYRFKQIPTQKDNPEAYNALVDSILKSRFLEKVSRFSKSKASLSAGDLLLFYQGKAKEEFVIGFVAYFNNLIRTFEGARLAVGGSA